MSAGYTPSEADRLWLLKVAWSLTNEKGLVDDLAQEGNIEMWRAAQTYDPACGVALVPFVRSAARYRMLRCVSRGKWFGSSDQRGHTKPPERELNVDDDLAIGENIDALLIAYHHGEIMEALAALPPLQRDKVIRRFWNDEIVPGSSWWNGSKGAKRKLRERLSHLKELV